MTARDVDSVALDYTPEGAFGGGPDPLAT